MCSQLPPLDGTFPFPISPTDKRIFMKEKNQQNKKVFAIETSWCYCADTSSGAEHISCELQPEGASNVNVGRLHLQYTFYPSLHNLIHRRLHFSRSSSHDPLDANPNRNIFQLGSKDLTFSSSRLKKHLPTCSTFSSNAQTPHWCAARCVRSETCGKSSADGKQANQYKRSTVDSATPPKQREKENFSGFFFCLSCFVLQYSFVSSLK